MRDGDALSLSKFDVYGEKIQKGIKGFILFKAFRGFLKDLYFRGSERFFLKILYI